MQLDHYVHTIGYALKAQFGERIHKLSLSGNFTCPNRDGTLGRGGCTFCNVRSFHDESADLPIAEQIRLEKIKINQAKRYLAYFQAYTSTYAEVETLKRLYDEAVTQTDIVGLCVGTRPDCVPDEALDLLVAYQDQGYTIWLELGLQTAHDRTQELIRRGHTLKDYQDTVQRAHQRGLKVCTHLIAGLPQETEADMHQTLQTVLDIGVEGIKLHPLMVVKGSQMAAAYQRQEIHPMTIETYAQLAASLIQETPASVIYHRVSATAKRPTLIAPTWCESRWLGIDEVGQVLAQTGSQGCKTHEEWHNPSALQ